jgi:signal recognition particle subunit SRP54
MQNLSMARNVRRAMKSGKFPPGFDPAALGMGGMPGMPGMGMPGMGMPGMGGASTPKMKTLSQSEKNSRKSQRKRERTARKKNRKR